MFVHRNIANLVVHTDLNLLSVLQFAVDVLRVKHVVLCGHYGCGGVHAAMSRHRMGLLGKWLRHIKDVYSNHRAEVDAFADPASRVNKLVEINVRDQVQNLAKTSIIQRAWHDRQGPVIHGWVFSLADGRIRELSCVGPGDPIDELYRYDFEDGPG
jgi:carbonic anhydrase